MGFDLDSYRRESEEFLAALDREHYLHEAGHKPELEIEPIYRRHSELFAPAVVAELRSLAAGASGEAARRLRFLLHFVVDGLLGRATRGEAERLARLEASLTVDAGDGEEVPYRGVPVAQANEPDSSRRAALAEARDHLLSERLTPLMRAATERERELLAELGWHGHAAAYAELRGIDLHALAAQARRFCERSEAPYEEAMAGATAAAGLPPLGEIGRSDLPRLFRAPGLDAGFPPERMVPSLRETLAGLGIDLGAQRNVHLDVEPRPTKSPRAFCSTPHVPGEVHLVVMPAGGRDDYGALFHEAGHAEHYACTDPGLAFEFRQLGDNSVTESFAFLLEHLTEDPEWMSERLGIAEPEPVLAHARALRLYFLRRYAAKIAYELELGAPDAGLDAMPARYAELLGEATRVRWDRAAWLADVDGGYYVACYLRAWSLETHWRSALRERFGPRWFAEPEAGNWLRALWRQGQRLGAEELLSGTLGGRLDFEPLLAELRPGA